MQKAGSHTSIPRFRPDKRTPKTIFAGETKLSELTTNQAQTVKKHAHKKQRQHDNRLSKPVEEGCPAHGLEKCFRCSVQAIIFGND